MYWRKENGLKMLLMGNGVREIHTYANVFLVSQANMYPQPLCFV